MLSVENVDLHYGAAQALRGVSLAAETGKVACVLGRNGVGKTSLLRAIIGQQPIATGAIVFDGRDVAAARAYDRARLGIAYVPQGREIFPLLTVERESGDRLRAAAARRAHHPDERLRAVPGAEADAARRGGDLSGGQQQQLAIGRALVTRPKLLVLDEPTEGIQPSIIKDIGRAIDFLRHKGEMAILLVEQYFEFARDLATATPSWTAAGSSKQASGAAWSKPTCGGGCRSSELFRVMPSVAQSERQSIRCARG